MPSKNTAATAVAEPAATGAPAPVEAPEPVVFEPATDEDDDEVEEDDEAQAAPTDTSGLDVAGLLEQFAALMTQREEQIWARMEERLAAVVPPASNGHVRNESAEAAAPPGELPSWMTMPNLETPPSATLQPRRPRMVAFIPKTDPYNPKQTTFKTWVNGREIRAKRGQVMILTAGHGIALARRGHGNCVDIAAMQGSLGEAATIPVKENPDYSMPNDWDGRPLTDRSSIPIGR